VGFFGGSACATVMSAKDAAAASAHKEVTPAADLTADLLFNSASAKMKFSDCSSYALYSRLIARCRTKRAILHRLPEGVVALRDLSGIGRLWQCG
jgi:hypothetical protein